MKTSINKKALVIIGSLLLFINSNAQQPAYEVMVDGVKVIVQPTLDEIVEIRTIIKGGVQNYTAEKAGIESIAMKMLTEGGTQNDDRNSFKNKLDKVSAAINGESGMDFSSYNLNCIKSDLNSVWSLYVDGFTKPMFHEKEFAIVKQNQVNQIRSQSSNPNFSIQQLGREVAFGGKAYAKNPMGTVAAVTALTPADAKEHFKTIANKKQVFMVMVGNIEKSMIEKMARDVVGSLPEGNEFQLNKEGYSTTKNTFKSEKKDLATNYVMGLAGGPQPGSKDYNAFLLAMNIMFDRHFLEVRTNNGLSYAPTSYFSGGLTAYSGFGASTTDPNKYIGVVNELIDRTRTKGFTEEEVKNKKTTYVTRLYYGQETNAGQANALALNEVTFNNWKRAIVLNDELRSVSAKDVSNAFNKYISNLTWVYQGNPDQVNEKLYTQAYKRQTPPEKLPKSTFTNKKIN